MTVRITTAIVSLLAGTLLAGCAQQPTPNPAPAEPVEQAEEVTPTPVANPLEEPLSGLIAIQDSGTGNWADGFTINGIDPATGEVEVQRMFPQVGDVTPEISLFTPIFTRMSFDPEFRRVAATTSSPTDGSLQVGWITDDGRFVNVSAALSDSGSAFSGEVNHQAPSFGPDGSFFFANESEKKIIKVTTENPSAPTDGTVALDYADEFSNPRNVWVYPSGTINLGYAGSIPRVENLTPGVWGSGRVEDWVTDVTMVTGNADQDDLILSDAVEGGPPIGRFLGSGTDTNRHSILPEREGRLSWNPVVSPDSASIAFLSAPEGGEEPATLFVVPTAGGEPVPVTTPYGFKKLGSGGFFGPTSFVQLVDWRP